MREITDKNIEKQAISTLIDYFEPQIEEVIKQSAVELNNINEMKEIQGIYAKNRIDAECIKKAIKTINGSNDIKPTEKGGIEQKKGENNVLHTPKERKTMGVEIT